ncbi:very short patch repair endonuclease [Herbiconiux daphne]|uniref:Very short patch repair endonuclease n=1 Tax=Herbiconiux daphne TaxID=2970914 RepID=A0ABT2H1H3_9MICO|nr:very short patch repair endonuclease [Herbiconiux daphne]MCS5733774.1 very short patch repair endonuclease [Herbiconiux daphne]
MSWASTPGVRRSMQSNRARDTKPELLVRRILHAQGFRYRVDWRPSPQSRTRADIAFTRQRVLVFIDGCFWHGCPTHATFPKTNQSYWLPKLAQNRVRDAAANKLLESLGWIVLRYWEHENPSAVAAHIASIVTTSVKS